MSEHTASVHWQRQPGEAFSDQRYHRAHDWRFDGGAVVPGSSSPLSVPLPFSDAQPGTGQHEALHHQAHEQCFIANSVTGEVRCDPTISC